MATFSLMKNGDILLQGVNTTALNREFIIRFTPKGAKDSQLITGRQLVDILKDSNRGKTLQSVWGRIQAHREDILTIRLRSTGQFTFIWR